MAGITLERAVELLTDNAAEIFDAEEIPLIESVGSECAEKFFVTKLEACFDGRNYT